MSSLEHDPILQSLKGVTDSRYSGKVKHYRGLQYAQINKRFAKPLLNEDWPGEETDCTRFGPRCPQPKTDVRSLMQIPTDLPANDPEEEDELRCTNLNVTCPLELGSKTCPVLVWLYGGSQVTSFGTAAQKIGDPGPLVAQSIEDGKPIIVVTPHYRLNLFAFGDRVGEHNLALQDQHAALQWVRKYISTFGGDPNNIILGGESAGAIYTHALLVSRSNSCVSRAILDSACLYTIPPQTERRCLGLIDLVEGNLQLIEMENGNMTPGEAVESTVSGAPAHRLIQTLEDLKVTSMWMWPETSLDGWDDDRKVFGQLKGVMISDCEFESVIYEHVASHAAAAKIYEAFETTPLEAGKKLAEVYGIDGVNVQTNRRGLLNFLNDVRFAYPAQALRQRLNDAGIKAYQYYFDQVNPFAKSGTARAHHAVDLFAVFGGYDGFVNEEMKRVGKALRSKWIEFMHGQEPWSPDHTFAFGPNGKIADLTYEIAAPRRRQKHFEVLAEVGHALTHQICLMLIGTADTDISQGSD